MAAHEKQKKKGLSGMCSRKSLPPPSSFFSPNIHTEKKVEEGEKVKQKKKELYYFLYFSPFFKKFSLLTLCNPLRLFLHILAGIPPRQDQFRGLFPYVTITCASAHSRSPKKRKKPRRGKNENVVQVLIFLF
jgi:hypothetical protein